MKIRLLCVGRQSQSWLRDGSEMYRQRLDRVFPCRIEELKEEKGGRKPDPRLLSEREGELLMRRIDRDSYVIALDERGRQLESTALATQLEQLALDGIQEIVFIIGGPYGLSESVRRRAQRILSLSAMTFTHQMVRLFLLEQLYRATTIMRNEPYHHG